MILIDQFITSKNILEYSQKIPSFTRYSSIAVRVMAGRCEKTASYLFDNLINKLIHCRMANIGFVRPFFVACSYRWMVADVI